MTSEERDYAEALRRIREAQESGSDALNLSELATLNRLPPELARLTSLQSLTLSNCRNLSGDLSLLAGLTSLHSLDFSYCGQLSGDLSLLASLTLLKSLKLESCSQLSGDLAFLAGLTSLQTLDISRCLQLRDFSRLATLTSLQTLNLSSLLSLRDLSPLAGLKSLKTLIIKGSMDLTGDLSPLARLKSLETLILVGCLDLTGDLSPLAGLHSLRALSLSTCDNLDLIGLERLRSLETLDISDLIIQELNSVAHLRSLRSLDLHKCILNCGLEPLVDLKSLETLDLRATAYAPGGLGPLAGLTSLKSLNLSGWYELTDLSPMVGLTSLQALNLSGCKKLSDLSPLAGLTSLQTLELSDCKRLSDLSPLAGLTSLQTLELSDCKRLSDLSPLAGLTSLQMLHLSGCQGIPQFSLVRSLLPKLRELYLFDCMFNDVDPAICGASASENVLDKICAHYKDLESGQRIDAEIKVLFLGNGGVGKTQLCRRLRDLPFDPNIPTTHGVQLGQTTVELDDFPEPVRLNLWDFGGQDIYHGSHALFLHSQAIFLLLWTPELECQTTYQEGELSLRHRPLSYWVDYLRAFAGTDASVLIVQSQCDTRDKRILHPPAPLDDFLFHRFTEVSARTGLNLGILKESIKEAVRDRFDRRPPAPIGIGRLKVRDRLRGIFDADQKREPAQRQHRLLERAAFDRICDEVGGVSDKNALLDFLHHNGVIFYRPGLFGNRIVLDQNWALEAIYAIFDRKKILPLLRGYGRFSRADLERLIWSDFTPDDQKVFLGMMESCGICFKVRELPDDEWEYIAPELLPEWASAQEQLLGRLRDEPPISECNARYAFLHDGILGNYLSKLGKRAGEAAIYWKYGCWFFERTTRSQVLIESIWDDAESQAGAGTIRLRAWGQTANNLVEILLQELRGFSTGQAPEISGFIRPGAHAFSTSSTSIKPNEMRAFNIGPTEGTDKAEKPLLNQLQIASRPALPPKSTPEIFVSYAWGDDSSDDARKRGEVVDRLCETLRQHGWHILRDKTDMRSGELISGFIKRIGLADHAIVVLSDKYLRSPYCMTELHSIYQRSVGEKEDFLRRIIPLRLADARFGTWRDRLVYTKHWRTEFEEMEQHFKDLGESDFRLYKAMQEWHNRIGDMLAYVNDVLVPHGFDEIVKDDFAALRQMLQQRR